MHISYNVLHKVHSVKFTSKMWLKLEALYMSKSFPNHIFLLEQFFSYKIDPSKDLGSNLDILNRLLLNL